MFEKIRPLVFGVIDVINHPLCAQVCVINSDFDPKQKDNHNSKSTY